MVSNQKLTGENQLIEKKKHLTSKEKKTSTITQLLVSNQKFTGEGNL